MKRLVFAILATAITSASYAQSAAEPAPNWSGFYLGANAGMLGGDDGKTAGTASFWKRSGWGRFRRVENPFMTVGDGRTAGMTSLIGGGQLGYNYQTGAVVWGGEADLQALSASQRNRFVDEKQSWGRFGYRVSTNVEDRQHYTYLGTVRGRVGYLAMPNLLVFATGGLAYAERQETLTLKRETAAARLSKSSTRTGYVVGGGIEYALDQSWSVKSEALYYDLGKTRGSGTVIASNPPFGTEVVGQVYRTSQDRGVIGRVGLNYRFSGW